MSTPPPTAPPHCGSQELVEIVGDLVRRVERLEREGRRPWPPGEDPLWVLQVLRERRFGDAGDVVFAGVVDTPGTGRVEWQVQRPVEELLGDDWDEIAPAVAALGHPVRLEIVRALLLGSHGVAELQQLPGVGTSGQLYHHLRELQHSGWVRQERRNYYLIPADRVLPALVIVAAAAGLRQGSRDASA